MVSGGALAVVVLAGMNRRDGDRVGDGGHVGQRSVDGAGGAGERGTGGRRGVVENPAERHGKRKKERKSERAKTRGAEETRSGRASVASGWFLVCDFAAVEGDGVGDGELVAVVAVESTTEAMAGNAHAFRFVAFSSHRYTLPNPVTRPAPSLILADEPASLPTCYRIDSSKALRDTASALAALSRQTPPVSDARVPPSPLSTSFPPCVLSWRTSPRLKLAD
jgi:hypothetical protein